MTWMTDGRKRADSVRRNNEDFRILTGAMLDLLSQMYSVLSIINKALNTSLEGLTRS